MVGQVRHRFGLRRGRLELMPLGSVALCLSLRIRSLCRCE